MMLRYRARMGSLALLFTGLALAGTSCGGDEFTQAAAGAGGIAGADASAGGNSGAQSGGSAGNQGGAAGIGGSSQGGAAGQGGSSQGGATGQGGSSEAGAGQGGGSEAGAGQGGSSEAGAGQGGSAGNAGSGGGPVCNFDACNMQTGAGHSDCNPCVAAVCAQNPGCCANSSSWGPYCVFVAHTLDACACGTLKCTVNNSGTPGSGGSCIPQGVPCNPLAPSMCGVGTHCTFDTVATPHFGCTPTGTQAGCASCSANQHCAAGMSCIFNKCVWPCCADADCGPGAVCKGGILLAGNTFGICMNPTASTD